jgi:coatomer subunit delta
MNRTGRANVPRAPSYNTYTPPVPTQNVPDTYDSYNAERNKATKAMPVRGKGMQLGKKSKTTNAFEQIKSELGPDAESTAPLVPSAPSAATNTAAASPTANRASLSSDREAIHVTIAESISAKFSREGSMETFEVKGDLQLRISDPSLTQIKLNLATGNTRGAQLTSHPKVDKTQFKNAKVIQLGGSSNAGFPVNNSIQVMRWKLSPKAGEVDDPPITFTVWVNDAGGNTWNITVEYEWTGGDSLPDDGASSVKLRCSIRGFWRQHRLDNRCRR